MAQNIYDRPDFFAGYCRLERSRRGLDGAPEWPAVRALLPDLAGRRVLDLGCGFGWFCRWARRAGAACVLGIDLSENMIARARSDTADPAIDYRIGDLDRLDLPEGAHDMAYGSLAFHYVEDFGRLAAVVHRALTPGSHFIFTVEHPVYTAPARPGWIDGGDGRRCWPVEGYSVEGPRRIDWLAEGVVKQHRTIGTTLNTLIGAGFDVRRVEEWAPSDAQVTAAPELAEERDRPMFLLVSAER